MAPRTFAVTIPPDGQGEYMAPPESIAGYSLRSVLLTTIDKLQAATEEYAVASADLAGATNAEAEARQALAWHEAIVRDQAHGAGLPGSNESARKAALDRLLFEDPMVAGMRLDHDRALRRRVECEHRFRVVDVAQKSLRARLDALAALVRQS